MCPSTTFATSYAIRIRSTTPQPYASCARWRARIAPDIVQINSSKAGVLARLALAGLGTRTVFTAHGWAFSGRGGAAGAVYTASEQAVAPLTDAIVCVSSHDLQLARERGIAPRGSLQVIHNGVDAPAALPPHRPPGSRLVLGCTARLAPPKDLITLLDALAQPGCEAWELRVFGDGPDREEIERHRDALGLGDRVALLGPSQRRPGAARRLRCVRR